MTQAKGGRRSWNEPSAGKIFPGAADVELHHSRKHAVAQTGEVLVPYYKLISNIMPRDDQTAFESLRNVLVKGTHPSEDLLITVFLEGRISSLVWQFLHVQFEWNMVREICLLEAVS